MISNTVRLLTLASVFGLLAAGCDDPPKKEALTPDPEPVVYTPLLSAELMPPGFEWVHWETLSDADLGKRYPTGEHNSHRSWVTSGFEEPGQENLESLAIRFKDGYQTVSITYRVDAENPTALCERFDATYRKLAEGMAPTITDQMGFTSPVDFPADSDYGWCVGVEGGKRAVRVDCGYRPGEITLLYWDGRGANSICEPLFLGETHYRPADRDASGGSSDAGE